MKTIFKITMHDARTLKWWRSRRDEIDMNPKYQRKGRLWSISDKAYLIDSIINEFDIPKLYIADFTYGDSPLNEKKLPYAIIDGKQRLEAIFDFFDGKIRLNDDCVYRKNENINIGGLTYFDLLKSYSEVAETFENYTLTIMSVISSSDELIKELFVRLNRNKPLTGAEIRNAMSGYAVEIIRQISSHPFFTDNIRFSINRATDQDISAKLLMLEFSEKILTTKKNNLDEFVKASPQDEKGKDKLELSGRRAIENLDNMANIFLPRDVLLSSAGIIPVYYWLIRELDARHFSLIRDFLDFFEVERKATLALISQEPNNSFVDREIVQFINFSRFPNDASSIEGRLRIIKNRFLKLTHISK